jgi:hypothetical protein
LAYLIGVVLAVVVGGIASLLRLDRDRAFYPSVLIVIASYYGLFAVMGDADRALPIEVTVAAGFPCRVRSWGQTLSLDRRGWAGGTRHL